MALEEDLAEKIARLNRVQFARDLFDLWWVGTHPPHSSFDEGLVATTAVLKCWVDTYGLHSNAVNWMAVDGATPLDPRAWLMPRAKVDDESIGLLLSPPPDLAQLRQEVSARYQFLAAISPTIAEATRRDRRALGDITRLIRELPGHRFNDSVVLY